MNISPTSLRRSDWIQIWAGSWSLLSCSHFAEEYTRLIKFRGQPFLKESLIVIRHGKSEGWARRKDREFICEHLAKEVRRNPRRAIAICRNLKVQSDRIRAFMRRYRNKDLTAGQYRVFWETLVRYYQPHINVKYVVDALTEQQLEKLLPHFERARTYAENVLSLTERFLESFARRIQRKTKIPAHLVLCMNKEEMARYLRDGVMPGRALLKQRDILYAIYSDRRRWAEYAGSAAQTLEKMLARSGASNTLRGTTAYAGLARGRVRMVTDPRNPAGFRTGDILVASMTRPEYLPLMKKAAAFVTDSGGILSHAAIVARELRKPCVIGTTVATKVLKNGDQVIVDAAKGLVKKI